MSEQYKKISAIIESLKLYAERKAEIHMDTRESNMKSKVYYGEFSLDYWVRLILTQNIVLPPYQRYFIWQEKDIKKFIKQLIDKSFVPPVTIGAYRDEFGNNQNLILDGQQRLTSILLAALKLCPDYDKMRGGSKEEKIQWTFKELLSGKVDSLSNISIRFQRDEEYKHLECGMTDDLLKSTYLGFSYIIPEVPDNTNNNIQQIFYSTVFRNINYSGIHLQPIESRKSLYYLNPKLITFFEPEFADKIIMTSTNKSMDFVRCLALLTQYVHNSRKVAEVLKEQKTTVEEMESYYESYIYAMVGNYDIDDYEDKKQPSELFGKYDEIFKGTDPSERLKYISKIIVSDLEWDKIKYESILAVDVYMFGLIYYMLFEQKEIELSKKEQLKQAIEDKIRILKRKDASQTNKPSNATAVRNRISNSIAVYRSYLRR